MAMDYTTAREKYLGDQDAERRQKILDQINGLVPKVGRSAQDVLEWLRQPDGIAAGLEQVNPFRVPGMVRDFFGGDEAAGGPMPPPEYPEYTGNPMVQSIFEALSAQPGAQGPRQFQIPGQVPQVQYNPTELPEAPDYSGSREEFAQAAPNQLQLTPEQEQQMMFAAMAQGAASAPAYEVPLMLLGAGLGAWSSGGDAAQQNLELEREHERQRQAFEQSEAKFGAGLDQQSFADLLNIAQMLEQQEAQRMRADQFNQQQMMPQAVSGGVMYPNEGGGFTVQQTASGGGKNAGLNMGLPEMLGLMQAMSERPDYAAILTGDIPTDLPGEYATQLENARGALLESDVFREQMSQFVGLGYGQQEAAELAAQRVLPLMLQEDPQLHEAFINAMQGRSILDEVAK